MNTPEPEHGYYRANPALALEAGQLVLHLTETSGATVPALGVLEDTHSPGDGPEARLTVAWATTADGSVSHSPARTLVPVEPCKRYAPHALRVQISETVR